MTEINVGDAVYCDDCPFYDECDSAGALPFDDGLETENSLIACMISHIDENKVGILVPSDLLVGLGESKLRMVNMKLIWFKGVEKRKSFWKKLFHLRA